MKTSPDLETATVPISAPWLERLRADIQQAPTPGNVIAIGNCGNAADCATLHVVMDSCEPESELAHACIISLENLSDRSDDGVSRVAPHLQIREHHYSATRMLTGASSALAWDALFEDIKREFDFINALNLINLSTHAEEVTELFLSQWQSYRGSDQISMLRLLIKRVRKEPYRTRILADTNIRNSIHELSTAAEGSFWFTGSKAAMVDCMVLFNPVAAFAAACRCLEDTDSHDREMYPALLMEIDKSKAIDWLVKHCAVERSASVRFAIGRALEDCDLVESVLSDMISPETAVRKAGCFLAGWSSADARVDRALIEALDDFSHDVVAEALEARRRRADREITRSLVELLEAEKDIARKGVLLDALVGVADPGGEHQALSPLLTRALDAAGPVYDSAAEKRIEKRRKKLAEKLKKLDR